MQTRFLKFVALILSLIIFSGGTVLADIDRGERKAKQDQAQRSSSDFKLDKRYDHNRSYPRDGHIITVLPKRRIPIHYHNRDYFYFGGVWYLPSGLNMVVVKPPFGIVVPVLPPYYTTVWLHNRPYYYANDIYYVWRADLNGYQVTAPPPEQTQEQTTYLADEIFIYPKQGQDEQQQANDRYECHRWGAEQSGYNPTLPPNNVTLSELGRLRENYQRAMKTCLEGRGYSVQ